MKKAKNEQELEAADELYADVMFIATPEKYRYIKMVVNVRSIHLPVEIQIRIIISRCMNWKFM